MKLQGKYYNLTLSSDQSLIVESMTSWARKLPKDDRCEVVDVMVLDRVFIEMYTLVDMVYMVVGRGTVLASLPFNFLEGFVLVE